MNLKAHPVRLGVLDMLDDGRSEFIVQRSRCKKNYRDVCLRGDGEGAPTRIVVMEMSIAGAMATAQILNAVLKHLRRQGEAQGGSHGGGIDIREVPGSDPRPDR